MIAEKGPADVRLQYDCNERSVCVMVRLQDPEVAAAQLADGLWFKGCVAVTHQGTGDAATPLDIELRRQRETCP